MSADNAAATSAIGGGPAESAGSVGAGGSGTATGGAGVAAGGVGGGTYGSSTGGTVIFGGGGQCPDAPCPPSCAFGFEPTVRLHGGCAACECAPPNRCLNDSDCPVGQICYAGADCDDGCAGTDCCAGNFCSLPGCGSTADVSCLVAGCANGERCLADCQTASCTCDGSSWRCDAGDGTTACTSACVAP